MGVWITAAVLFLVSLGAFVMSIRSFREKGFLLNNAYLYASKREREAMDKKPYYRQSAIVFAMIGVIFLLNGLALLLRADWMFYGVGAVVQITAIYAVGSSMRIEKKKKQK